MRIPHNHIGSFFGHASKVIIILPLFILAVGVLVKVTSSDKKQQPASFATVTATPSQKKLNLTGPFVCQDNAPTGTVSAYIKNKELYAEVDTGKTQDRYLYTAGCLYLWKGNAKQGEKICGMERYVSIAEGFLNLGIGDANSIIGEVLKGQKIALPVDIGRLVASCTQAPIPGTVVFRIPQGVLFVDVTTPDSVKPSLKK